MRDFTIAAPVSDYDSVQEMVMKILCRPPQALLRHAVKTDNENGLGQGGGCTAKPNQRKLASASNQFAHLLVCLRHDSHPLLNCSSHKARQKPRDSNQKEQRCPRTGPFSAQKSPLHLGNMAAVAKSPGLHWVQPSVFVHTSPPGHEELRSGGSQPPARSQDAPRQETILPEKGFHSCATVYTHMCSQQYIQIVTHHL